MHRPCSALSSWPVSMIRKEQLAARVESPTMHLRYMEKNMLRHLLVSGHRALSRAFCSIISVKTTQRITHLQIFNCGLITKSEMCELTGCCQTQLSILHLLIWVLFLPTVSLLEHKNIWLKAKAHEGLICAEALKETTIYISDPGESWNLSFEGRNLTRFSDLLQSFTWGHLRSWGRQENLTRLRPWRTGFMLPLEVWK